MRKLILLIVIVYLLPCILGLDVNIDVNNFSIGEKIYFDYKLSSGSATDISFAPYITCPRIETPLLVLKTASLNPGEVYSGRYEFVEVTDKMDSQQCVANIEVLSPEYEKFKKEFNIKVLFDIIFRVLTCKDASCESESKIFIKGENIYFSHISEPGAVTAKGLLTYPDNSQEELTIPASIKAEQIGTYFLEVAASKEGYKTQTVKGQFGVIEKQAKISSATTSDIGGSNLKNLFEEESSKKKIIFIVVIFSSIILLIAVFLVIKGKNKSKKT